jgi:hypothetical protein
MKICYSTLYFINRAKKVHDDKYDYSEVNYINCENKVIIKCNNCKSVFEQTPYHHLAGHGCKICNRRKSKKIKAIKETSQNRFLRLANIKHEFYYDYSKVNYLTQKSIINITCPKHGNFMQKAKDHLKGSGCIKCGREKISISRSENTTGWGITNWIKASEISNYFDSYKVYIIEVYDDKERFIKIGRTYNTVKHRFRNKKLLPYNYKILMEIVDNPIIIFNFENQLKKELKEYKYKPLIKFSGMEECFNLDIISILTRDENKKIIISVK